MPSTCPSPPFPQGQPEGYGTTYKSRVSEVIADFIENCPRDFQTSWVGVGRQASSQYAKGPKERDSLCAEAAQASHSA